VLTSQASPVSGSARYVATAPRKRWLIGGGQGLTRRLGMDREDPRCGPVRDDRSRNQAGRWCARQALTAAGPAAARCRARAGAVRAGPPASRGTALTPEAGGGIGCRCRSPAAGRCLGSCRCPGHMPGATGLEALWQTWSRRRRSHELRFGG